MSSSTLTIIQTQLILYEYPIFLILGNIGNVFIVILFSRQRRNACSIYLTSAAISNDIYLTFNSLTQIFPFYYGDQTIRAFALCKLRLYFVNIFGPIAKIMFVLACIDRFLITNDRASVRSFSTPKRAKQMIVFFILFWPLFVIHIPILTTIINGQCNTFGIYSIVYTAYLIIFVGFTAPILLSIFGFLTFRNMRERLIRVQPNGNNENIVIRRQDRDLFIIVISEVFVYVITTAPSLLVLLETTISKYTIPNKSVQYAQIENFIYNIAYSLSLINTAAPFYIYLISSKSFRRDFKQLIINVYRKLRRQPIGILTVSRVNETVTQRDTRV